MKRIGAGIGLSLLVVLPALAGDWLYRMQPGDSIWSLSREYLKEPKAWQALQRYNGVSKDRAMPVGKQLRIPEDWLVMDIRQAVVASVQGGVRVIDADSGKMESIQAGRRIGERDVLITDKNGGVSVRLPDGSLVLVGPASRVRVDRLREYGRKHRRDIHLQLRQGELENHIEKRLSPGDRFEIETPAAVTAVRGTEYRVTADAQEKRGGAEVLKGLVGVSNRLGGVAVKQGFGSVVQAGRPPSRPRPLLPAPRLDVAAEQHDPALLVRWRPVAGAVSYQIEVARDEAFLALVASASPSTTQAAFPGLPDGVYHVRARAVDGLGLRGFDATARVTLDAHPLRPLLLSPPDGAVRFPKQVSLSWRAGDDFTRAFRVQLASRGDFEHPLIDKVLTGNQLQPDTPLPPGDYAWRVAGIDDQDDQGLFSAPRRLVVRPLPPPPDLAVKIEPLAQGKAQAGKRVVVHLPAPRPGVAYRLRLDDEARSDKPLWVKQVAGGDVEVALHDPGVFWLRAQRLDTANGIESAYSEPLKLENPSGFGRWLILLGAALIALF